LISTHDGLLYNEIGYVCPLHDELVVAKGQSDLAAKVELLATELKRQAGCVRRLETTGSDPPVDSNRTPDDVAGERVELGLRPHARQ
jgi:hypothetical protein